MCVCLSRVFCVCVCVYFNVDVYFCVCVCLSLGFSVCVCVCVRILVWTCISVCVCVSGFLCVCVCAYFSVDVYFCVCVFSVFVSYSLAACVCLCKHPRFHSSFPFSCLSVCLFLPETGSRVCVQRACCVRLCFHVFCLSLSLCLPASVYCKRGLSGRAADV